MRACLAILIDSFREAAASRVLWIAIGAIALILTAIAPLGLSSVPGTQLRPSELTDAAGLLQVLSDGRESTDSPAGHVWKLLNEEQRTQIEDWLKAVAADSGNSRTGGASSAPAPGSSRSSSRGRIQSRTLELVNKLLARPDFYIEESWRSVEMDQELRATDAESENSNTRMSRNLKRLAAAFPSQISVQNDLALSLTYGNMTLFGPLRQMPTQADELINVTIMGILSIFLGFFGIFSSLIVTSTIIPRTFEPGEISLLLSKPIRRSVLFVTKFLGGCVFTLLCAAMLVVGVWLLLGIRFGLWRPELLLCIPLYVFLFAVYFSVSAFAGAIWRNATVSLIIVVVFWVVVTTVGSIHAFMDTIYIRSQQIVEITASGSEVFVIDGSRAFSRWNGERGDWAPIFEHSGGNSFEQAIQRLLRSRTRTRIVASSDGQTIWALQPEFARFGTAAPASLVIGHQENGYIRELEGSAPEPVYDLFLTSDDKIIVAGSRGVHRFVGVAPAIQQTQAYLKRLSGGLIPFPSPKAFEKLTPETLEPLQLDAAVALNAKDDTLNTWSNGVIRTLVRSEDGIYLTGSRRDLEIRRPAVIAAGGRRLLCATAGGKVLILDQQSLDTIVESELPHTEKPRIAEMTPDGSLGLVLTHSGRILLYDVGTGELINWTPAENGSVSAATFDATGQLVVADGRRSVRFYDVRNRSRSRVLSGQVTWPYYVFDFVVRPLYLLLPKPSELDNVIRYVVTGEKTIVLDGEPEDTDPFSRENLNQQRITFDLRRSFLSNLTFIAVMVLLSCLYLIRRDF